MQVLSSNEKKESALSMRLLIVEADAVLRATLTQQLALEGFDDVMAISIVANIDELLSKVSPDLVLLDLQLPTGNSVDICRKFRSKGFAKPIVMLTASGANEDIARGLGAGANDYIAKPLRMVDLIACIRKQLHWSRISDDTKLEIGNLSFIPSSKTLSNIKSDRAQILTEKETTILKFLYQAFPGDVCKVKILEEIWGLQNTVSTHTLETHIYRLRQKIRQLTDKKLVITTDRGYRLVG